MRRFSFVIACLFWGLWCPCALSAEFELTDDVLDAAIANGAAYLWAAQEDDGSWKDWKEQGLEKYPGYPVGPAALVTYALLETGGSIQDPRMIKALQWLRTHPTDKTYSLGIRANVFLAAVRQRGKYRDALGADVIKLYKSTANGSYGYNSRGEGSSRGDNSNSQYGLLGVWAGARAGMEVPDKYWRKVLDHWRSSQNDDGGWAYGGERDDSTNTMTAAGVASVYVCMDNLLFDAYARGDKTIDMTSVRRGLAWFDRNFTRTLGRTSHFYYYLFGVERVGLASGHKYFGTADWYGIGARKLLSRQSANGSWGRSLVNTSFALLFLSHGRQPVLFNKLQFDGDWNNRPRDLASLTRWITKTFERPVNWQIINLRVPVRHWHDAPILYISGKKAPKFSSAEINSLRKFVYQGGTIFSAVQLDGRSFGSGIRKAYREMFPDYELTGVPPDHELRSVHFKIRTRPKLRMITNGIRPLVIHTDDDLPLAWQFGRSKTQKWAFEAATNIFMYVTGKGSLRSRGVGLYPPAPKTAPERTIHLARLKHSGNNDPEPLAYERFSRLLAKRTLIGLKVFGPMDITNLPASGVKIATLTGTESFMLTEEEKEALRQFVEAGGLLVIDAAGGSKAFAESAEKHLGEAFPDHPLRRIAGASPLLRLEDFELEKVHYRRRTRIRLGKTARANLRGIEINDRLGVLFSREDITAGLLGVEAYSCDGYTPSSAYEIMRNAVILAGERPSLGAE